MPKSERKFSPYISRVFSLIFVRFAEKISYIAQRCYANLQSVIAGAMIFSSGKEEASIYHRRIR